MAITIEDSPQIFSPAYNPMFSVVSSDNTAEDNFQYVCDLYITGQTFPGSSYLRLKAPTNPDNGNGVFDVSRIVERYLSHDVGNDIYGFQNSPNSILEYTLKFGEEYGPSSGITVYEDLTVDSARYAFNGVFDFIPFTIYDYTDYITGASDRKQLSTHPENFSGNTPAPIRANENAWTSIMLQSSGDVKFAQIKTYKENNTLQLTMKIINHQYLYLSPKPLSRETKKNI